MPCIKKCECQECEMLSTESVKILDSIDSHSEHYHYKHYYKCLYTGNIAPTIEELKNNNI